MRRLIGRCVLVAAALGAACAPEPVNRETVPAVLASESAHPELGELFWHGQQLQATDVWHFAVGYCGSAPTKPNCAPVLNLLSIDRLTTDPKEDSL